jgi:Glycosyltransferase family 17
VRIFDCILVCSQGDLDLLEARFAEYQDLDVIHVICEAAVTFDGKPKPLHFAESPLWRRFHGKWNHVRAEAHELPASAPPREQKNALREYLSHGVSADPDDIILHGSPDEIPSEKTLRGLLNREASVPVGMEMRWCAYEPHLVHPLPWRGTVAQEWRLCGSFAGMRERRLTLPAIVNAGTRLSMQNEEVPPDGRHPDGHALRETEIDDTYPRWVRSGLSPQ